MCLIYFRQICGKNVYFTGFVFSKSIFTVSESANEWTFYSFIGTEKLFQKEMSSCWALSDGLIIFSREIE